jgi:hypothetical protein
MSSKRLAALLDRLRRLIRRPSPGALRVALLLGAVALSYDFIITAGTFTRWPTWNNVYDLVAEGFRSGHLYTRISPRPELLRSPAPLDPSMYRYWIWDASLHNGHVYFYWGPLPGLILAALKTVLRWSFVVGDQYFVYWFYVVHLVAGTLLITRMARRLFPELPSTLVGLGVLVFAYASPTPFIVATPGIYQAAIVGGQAFLLLGMVFAADAVWNAAAGPPSRRLLLAAGCVWALGIATRISIVLPLPLLIILSAFLIARPGHPGGVWRQRLRAMVWLGAPVAAAFGALLLYNHARFDAFFEFGTGNQMSTMRFRTSLTYFLPNLYSYLFRPIITSCQFPYLTAPFKLGARAFPDGYQLPPGYWNDEPVAGLVFSTPWIWFVPVAVGFAARAVWRALRSRPRGMALDERGRNNVWFVASFAVVGTVTGLPIIVQFIATMRYLVDFTSGLVLLATWGAWSLHQSVRHKTRPRRAVTAAIVAIAVATIVIGLLLGMTGYNGMFSRNNPLLWERMVRAFSVCGWPAPH